MAMRKLTWIRHSSSHLPRMKNSAGRPCPRERKSTGAKVSRSLSSQTRMKDYRRRKHKKEFWPQSDDFAWTRFCNLSLKRATKWQQWERFTPFSSMILLIERLTGDNEMSWQVCKHWRHAFTVCLPSHLPFPQIPREQSFQQNLGFNQYALSATMKQWGHWGCPQFQEKSIRWAHYICLQTVWRTFNRYVHGAHGLLLHEKAFSIHAMLDFIMVCKLFLIPQTFGSFWTTW